MIIDSHAHYSHKLYQGEYPFACYEDGSFDAQMGNISSMIDIMQQKHIVTCIEAATSFDKIEDQLALISKYPDYFRLALGVHPDKCTKTSWSNRKKLKEYVNNNDIIAIGETGLDYHNKVGFFCKIMQKRWFKYQLRLAHHKNLPLILHTRMADYDVLRILRRHSAILHGGVAHCFVSDYQTARQYIDLGYYIGIGGKLFENKTLQDTVKRIPLESILVETDAPYIVPEITTCSLSNKKKKKARNSSLILPAVIEQIAAIRGENKDDVEKVIYNNTLKAFGRREL